MIEIDIITQEQISSEYQEALPVMANCQQTHVVAKQGLVYCMWISCQYICTCLQPLDWFTTTREGFNSLIMKGASLIHYEPPYIFILAFFSLNMKKSYFSALKFPNHPPVFQKSSLICLPLLSFMFFKLFKNNMPTKGRKRKKIEKIKKIRSLCQGILSP